MNLRYYLRGLGIGIIVTAIIMGISSGRERSSSPAPDQAAGQEQQEEKDGGVLADLEAGQDTAPALEAPLTETSGEPSDEEMPDQDPEQPDTDLTDTEPEAGGEEEDLMPDQAPEEEEQTEEDQSGGDQTEDTEGGDVIVIKISEGDSSYAVSMMLEEAGLVASASAFDRYLYDNGYDRKLRFGTYEIPVDTQPERIAEILAGNR